MNSQYIWEILRFRVPESTLVGEPAKVPNCLVWTRDLVQFVLGPLSEQKSPPG